MHLLQVCFSRYRTLIRNSTWLDQVYEGHFESSVYVQSFSMFPKDSSIMRLSCSLPHLCRRLIGKIKEHRQASVVCPQSSRFSKDLSSKAIKLFMWNLIWVCTVCLCPKYRAYKG